MANELNYETTVLEVHILLTVYIPFKFHVGNLSNSYVKLDKIVIVDCSVTLLKTDDINVISL